MRGIPMLLDMLTYKRPAGSFTEEEFIRRFIIPTGAKQDDMGNHILEVGEGSRVAWLSHTDTVHRKDGRQRLQLRNGKVSLKLPEPKKGVKQTFTGECLGADDTTGVWLMLEMIAAKVPGLYIFHYGEEMGCIGSSYIAKYTPELIEDRYYAISLDRRGEDSVVTHQLGIRTASDVFAWSLIDALDLDGAMPDPSGVFTDSERYAEIVPECTNLSVGYDRQHSFKEIQDLDFAAKLRNKLTSFDESRLCRERNTWDYEDLYEVKDPYAEYLDEKYLLDTYNGVEVFPPEMWREINKIF